MRSHPVALSQHSSLVSICSLGFVSLCHQFQWTRCQNVYHNPTEGENQKVPKKKPSGNQKSVEGKKRTFSVFWVCKIFFPYIPDSSLCHYWKPAGLCRLLYLWWSFGLIQSPKFSILKAVKDQSNRIQCRHTKAFWINRFSDVDCIPIVGDEFLRADVWHKLDIITIANFFGLLRCFLQ